MAVADGWGEQVDPRVCGGGLTAMATFGLICGRSPRVRGRRRDGEEGGNV